MIRVPAMIDPACLAADDPSVPAFVRLDAIGAAYRTVEHPPLYTVADSRALRGEIAGGHTKNLFLKDKGGALFLVTAEEGSPLDLKLIDKTIGARGRVSFPSAAQLVAHLGVEPGSVSPLALVNDRAGVVRFVLERKLLGHALINVHPLVNTRTTSLATADLLAYARQTGHEPLVLDLPYRAATPAADAG